MNPPCKVCVNGVMQDLVTNTSTNGACNTTSVSETVINASTIMFNLNMSKGCTGPPGRNANVTILIKNNSTNITLIESVTSSGPSNFKLDIHESVTYYTQPGIKGHIGPTGIIGPQGPPGPVGPQGIRGVLPLRTFRVTGPLKQYIPVNIPAGVTLFSYTLVGGGGGGAGGCGEAFAGRGGGAGGGGGSGFKAQGFIPIDHLNPPVITLRLGLGGRGSLSGVVPIGGNSRIAGSGYPTQLLVSGEPFIVSLGGLGGVSCNPASGGNGGNGGDGGYGGGGGGCTHDPGGGGDSQLAPYSLTQNAYYTHGGKGAGPYAGIGGTGDNNIRTGGGGGGGGVIPGSGGNGANFLGTEGDGGGGQALPGLYGGGGGGAPGCKCNVGTNGADGGVGYVEYTFF